jgi:hypothetical protein
MLSVLGTKRAPKAQPPSYFPLTERIPHAQQGQAQATEATFPPRRLLALGGTQRLAEAPERAEGLPQAGQGGDPRNAVQGPAPRQSLTIPGSFLSKPSPAAPRRLTGGDEVDPSFMPGRTQYSEYVGELITRRWFDTSRRPGSSLRSQFAEIVPLAPLKLGVGQRHQVRNLIGLGSHLYPAGTTTCQKRGKANRATMGRPGCSLGLGSIPNPPYWEPTQKDRDGSSFALTEAFGLPFFKHPPSSKNRSSQHRIKSSNAPKSTKITTVNPRAIG